MTISSDLFAAILAMDSYNRGYNSGLAVSGSNIGNATLGNNSSVLDQTPNEGRDQAASFFAQSYTWNGQTIISYRGTDAGSDM